VTVVIGYWVSSATRARVRRCGRWTGRAWSGQDPEESAFAATRSLVSP